MHQSPLLRFQAVGSLFVIGVALSSLSACRKADPAANAQAPQAVPVGIAAVKTGVVDNSEEFVATLESRQSVELKPRVSGQVQKIFVRQGDTVAAGTPIMQIDAREQTAAVTSKASEISAARASVVGAIANADRATADLETARADLKTLEANRAAIVANLNLREAEFTRAQSLYTSGAASKQFLDTATSALDSAKASLSAADANIQAQKTKIQAQQSQVTAQQAAVSRSDRLVQQAQADTAEQAARLDFYTITAAFAGTVGRIPVKEGDYVSSAPGGGDSVLATLSQNDQLEVNISIPLEKAPQLGVGTRVELLNEQGKQIGSSRVFFVSPRVAADTQSVLVKARVENATGRLKADQFIKARVVWDRTSGVMVPTTAIARLAGQNFIYVAENSDKGLVAKQKPIKVGIIRGQDQQVTEGLKPGEQIVISGIQKIADGAPIISEAEMQKMMQQQHGDSHEKK
jgi:RND family efflux transporter MFP subunit